jgi:O-antigen/teichoic acid export membrane protein
LDSSGNSLERRVLAGTGMHLASRVVTAACSASAAFLNGRWLGEAAFGRFSFHLSLFLMAGTLVDLGSFAIAVRESTRTPEREPQILRAAFRLRLAAIVVCVAALVAVALWKEGPGRAALLPSLAALHLFAIAPALAGAWLQTRVRLFWLALAPVVGMASYLGGSLLLRALAVRDPGWFLIAFGGGIALQSLVPWLATWRVVRLRGPRDRALERGLLKEMAPLGVSSAASTVYFREDALLLATFHGDAAVGRFQHSFQLLSFSVTVPSNLTAALLPALLRAAQAGGSRLSALVRRVAAVLAGISLPAAALALSFSPQVLWLLWVRRHAGADAASAFPEWVASHGDEIAAARLLSLAAIAVFLTYPQMTALIALSRQAALGVLSVAALLVKSAVALVAIARFGVVGAAATTLAIEAGVFLASALVLRRHAGGTAVGRPLLRPALVALLAGVVAALLRDLPPAPATAAALLLLVVAFAASGALPLRLGIAE